MAAYTGLVMGHFLIDAKNMAPPRTHPGQPDQTKIRIHLFLNPIRFSSRDCPPLGKSV